MIELSKEDIHDYISLMLKKKERYKNVLKISKIEYQIRRMMEFIEQNFEFPICKDPEFDDLIKVCQVLGTSNPLKGIRNDAQYRERNFVYDLQKIANKHKSYNGQPYSLSEIKRLINIQEQEDILARGNKSELDIFTEKRNKLTEQIERLDIQIREFERLDGQMKKHYEGKSK